MNASQFGQAETQIRALERGLVLMGGDLDQLRKRARILGQGIAELGDYAFAAAPSPFVGACSDPTLVGIDFVANGRCIPTVMPFGFGLQASLATFGTLTWDGATVDDINGKWQGCVTYNRPTSAGCSARAIPLFFTLRSPYDPLNTINPGDWDFTIEWIMTSGSCPDAGKTCADYGQVTHATTANFGSITTVADGQIAFNGSTTVPGSLHGFSGSPTTFTSLINLNVRTDNGAIFSQWLPQTFTIKDSLYNTGGSTMTWLGGSWIGCKAGIAYPGFGACGAVTMATSYTMGSPAGLPDQRWAITAFSANCPVPTTCIPPSTNAITPVNDVAASTRSPLYLKYNHTAFGSAGVGRNFDRNQNIIYEITT